MNSDIVAMAASKMRTSPDAPDSGRQFKIEIQALDHSGNDQFREALERHMNTEGIAGVSGKSGPARESNSLGKAVVERTANLSSEMKKDQQYVSKLLEQATRSGDEMHLMRAMMALSDFQLRTQMISKTVSKAATSIDSLTKLQ